MYRFVSAWIGCILNFHLMVPPFGAFENGKAYLCAFTIGLMSVKVDDPTITAWIPEDIAVPVNHYINSRLITFWDVNSGIVRSEDWDLSFISSFFLRFLPCIEKLM